MREQTQFCKELIDKARELMDRSKKSDDVDESEQLITTADEMIKLAGTSNRKFEAKYATELDRLISVVDSGKKKELQELVVEALQEAKDENLYLTAEDQRHRRIAFIHCEDEDGCGFGLEFKHPNCTFFFCKEHRWGTNLDLDSVPTAGVKCEIHGQMKRYDLLKEDNVCPICEKSTLAILSVGR